ncbi:hypothetical protein FNF28_04622 [Cafeteria roenbergensis]|uniref:AAA+ ATPase domain-containing protein n=3 Tax=Cafeteria roenbergensis TaxID=33653 RepID=A0A5A8DCK8_CAFRO|nr:hypothetical protein FNF28_04622 [Cafeteria roenbergensis]
MQSDSGWALVEAMLDGDQGAPSALVWLCQPEEAVGPNEEAAPGIGPDCVTVMDARHGRPLRAAAAYCMRIDAAWAAAPGSGAAGLNLLAAASEARDDESLSLAAAAGGGGVTAAAAAAAGTEQDSKRAEATLGRGAEAPEGSRPRLAPLDRTKADDGCLAVGAVTSALLKDLDGVVRGVLGPCLRATTAAEWGEGASGALADVAAGVDRAGKGVRDARATVYEGLRLRQPQSRAQLEMQRVIEGVSAPQPALVRHLVDVISSHCQQVEAFVQGQAASAPHTRARRNSSHLVVKVGSDAAAPRSWATGGSADAVDVDLDTMDAAAAASEAASGGAASRGPPPGSAALAAFVASEAAAAAALPGPRRDFAEWRRRQQRLASITEQLAQPGVEAAAECLAAASRSTSDFGVDPRAVSALLRRWRAMRMHVTEAFNEAADTCKYLGTLEPFVDPLYTGSPGVIVDALPALLNAIRMVHGVSRFFCTTERMTAFFVRLTNQLVLACRKHILGGRPAQELWGRSAEAVCSALEDCVNLNEAYQAQFRRTKADLEANPRGRQFDMSEAQVFGELDVFCRRLLKLLDLFSTVHQFRRLQAERIDVMLELCAAFFALLDELRGRRLDVLDYRDGAFDRAYIEFNVRLSDLDTSLQFFINRAFEKAYSVREALSLLRRFRQLLRRDHLLRDLDEKQVLVFHQFGLQILQAQRIYEEDKDDPPLPRDLPPVAGHIAWARHLLRRVQEPMELFRQQAPDVLNADRDCRRIVRLYNRLACTLVAFEESWLGAWAEAVPDACRGLSLPVLRLAEPTGATPEGEAGDSLAPLEVNFDAAALQLAREARCLRRMGCPIPERADMVLAQQAKHKGNFLAITDLLSRFEAVQGAIPPTARELLGPAVQSVRRRMWPGLRTHTWTSLRIQHWVADAGAEVERLRGLVQRLADLVDLRVQRNLGLVAKTVLVDLPKDRGFTLDQFVQAQQARVRTEGRALASKNAEVEAAVADAVAEVMAFPLDEGVAPPSAAARRRFRSHYNDSMYSSLLSCVRSSLQKLRDRVCAKTSGIFFIERPFFVLDVQLSAPAVRLVPSLDDVQRALNKAAAAVIRTSKRVFEWEPSSADLDDALWDGAASAAASLEPRTPARPSIAVTGKASRQPADLPAANPSPGTPWSGRADDESSFFSPDPNDLGQSRPPSSAAASFASGQVRSTAALESPPPPFRLSSAPPSRPGVPLAAGGAATAAAASGAAAASAGRNTRPNPLSSSGALNPAESAALARSLGPRRGDAEDDDLGSPIAARSDRGSAALSGGGAGWPPHRPAASRHRRRVAFFDRIGRDIEIVKMVLLLTGAFHGTRKAVARFLQQFTSLSWLWRGEPAHALAQFLRRQPTLSDFDQELSKLAHVDEDVSRVLVVHVIGALALNTSTLKSQLVGLNARWKRRFADQLHHRAREGLGDLTSYMARINEALGREVSDLSGLYELAEVLKEVREGESAIEGRISPVLDRYAVLRRHLPGVYEEASEQDAQATLRRQWERLADRAEEVSDSLAERQAGFKGELLARVRALARDVEAFRADFEAHGPMERGLQPDEAVVRITRVRGELAALLRRLADARRGERLFALRQTPFPALDRTQRELRIASTLFDLCVDAERAAQDFASSPWSKAAPAVSAFGAAWARLEERNRRLPRQTRAWLAHRRLGQLLEHFREALPSLELLVRPQVRPWHWRSVMRVLGATWPMEAMFQTHPTPGLEAAPMDVYPSSRRHAASGSSAASASSAGGTGAEGTADSVGAGEAVPLARDGVLRVGELVARNLSLHAADIEDIADTADKQAVIGARVTELRQRWWQRGLDFEPWRERSDVVVVVRYTALLEELEEAQLQAQTLLSMRQVEPYRDATMGLLRHLSDISDTMTLWLRVQDLWSSLESVFMGTDISRQLPADSRRFARADREWAALMAKAEELHTVSACTGNDSLRSTLPRLLDAFEMARHRLEGFLELKRGQLPRLFLVSDQALLTLLSKGSDPMAVQPLYSKLFEAVTRVVHARPTPEQRDAAGRGAGRLFGPIVTLVNSCGGGDSQAAGGAAVGAGNAVARAARQEREEFRLSEGCEVCPEGPTEAWLLRLQRAMQASVHDACGEVAEAALEGLAPRRLAALFPAQMAVVGLQLQWAEGVTRALDLTVAGQRSALADALKRQTAVLSELSELSLDVAAAQQAAAAAQAAAQAAEAAQGAKPGGLRLGALGGQTAVGEAVRQAERANPVGPGRELQAHAGADESMLRGLIRGVPGALSRTKAETLVTLQLHHRDVVQELFRRHRERKLGGTDDFEFTRRARVHWVPDAPNAHSPHVGSGALQVSVADVTLPCSYEWLGVTSRLVVTPLTDRAYLAFTQAARLHAGLAPAGPAGTGKTETVKDMARLLNAPCVVSNCSEQVTPADLARVLKGLAGAGAVGCFDEFNRLLVGALSVAAEQFGAVAAARRAGATEVLLPGDASPAALLPRCIHVAVTMNPRGKDYAGRSELPDNLKSLFRPVAMMVPDREAILRVRLCALGFREFSGLATKLDALFGMAQRTLSSQRHYDWGLRGVLAVMGSAGTELRAVAARSAAAAARAEAAEAEAAEAAERAEAAAAGGDLGSSPAPTPSVGLAGAVSAAADGAGGGGGGALFRSADAARPSAATEHAVVRAAVLAATLGKLVPEDAPQLLRLVADVFGEAGRREGGAASPGSAEAEDGNWELDAALRAAAASQGLTAHPGWLSKCRQLHSAAMARHAVAVIGGAGTGKTCATDTLAAALSALSQAAGGRPVTVSRMAPKAVAGPDLFGVRDARSGEWIPGVVANMWAASNAAAGPSDSWLVLDGPIDPRWVEDLNSAMDDTRTLTLSNGERLPMQPTTRLLLEAGDMANASPATVSRAGIVFFGRLSLGWEPVLEAWLAHQPFERATHFRAMFRRYVVGDRRQLAAVSSSPSPAAFAPAAATQPQPGAMATGEWRARHEREHGVDPGLPGDATLLGTAAMPARLAAAAATAAESGGCLFQFLRQFTQPAASRSAVAVVSTLLSLLTALLREAGLAEAIEAEAAALGALAQSTAGGTASQSREFFGADFVATPDVAGRDGADGEDLFAGAASALAGARRAGATRTRQGGRT